MKPTKASVAYREFTIKVVRVCEPPAQMSCDTPALVYDAWHKGPAQSDWYDETKECIVVFMLNTKLRLMGFQLISLGSINECTARITEILRPCIIANCHSFVVSHNHPSGDPLPSQADIDLTRRLNEAARTMGIRLQDHVIVGQRNYVPNHSGYFSFREGGLL